MSHAFWQERWDSGQIAFHEGAPNAMLVAHARHLPTSGRVLVPLAGKAEDLIFLRDRGLAVVGVEFVEKACRQFFDDHDVIPRIDARPPFKVFAAAAIELWCGDIFDCAPEQLGTFDAIYDRAALIALLPTDRRRYVKTLASLLKPGGTIFLVALHYDQSRADGPPWSLDDQHVRELFMRDFVIEPLDVRPGHANQRLRAAGVTHFEDRAYRLTELRRRTGERARARPPR